MREIFWNYVLVKLLFIHVTLGIVAIWKMTEAFCKLPTAFANLQPAQLKYYDMKWVPDSKGKLDWLLANGHSVSADSTRNSTKFYLTLIILHCHKVYSWIMLKQSDSERYRSACIFQVWALIFFQAGVHHPLTAQVEKSMIEKILADGINSPF